MELGRGAMGVTYKAFDVDLRCAMTLKVISEKYVGDEASRLRFLREARAAASVRHPNVASVFHLGRTGENYFYAMEFVEGETLERFLKRSGRLEIRTAMEITKQVAAGLAAVHKQKLVHRDIKPSNIMVNFEEEGAVTAKIIDLGLAKAVDQPTAQTTISTFGHFAGTPEYASPEQFGGVGVDIRSDLYSVGVLLWEMLAGNLLFRGSPAELMHQHQHAVLPLEQLQGVPQSVVWLIKMLLDKDPKRRSQTPAELLKAMSTIGSAIDTLGTAKAQLLQQTPATDPYIAAFKPRTTVHPEKILIERLPRTRSDVFNREDHIAFLSNAWENQSINVIVIVARTGFGKSTLLNHWLDRMSAENYRSARLFLHGPSSRALVRQFLRRGFFSCRFSLVWRPGSTSRNSVGPKRKIGQPDRTSANAAGTDGLELLQYPSGPQEGRMREPSVRVFLHALAAFNSGLCVVTSRLAVADLADHDRSSVLCLDLPLWQQWMF